MAVQQALFPVSAGRVPYALCRACQKWYHPLVMATHNCNGGR
jgi:hypothetical protein